MIAILLGHYFHKTTVFQSKYGGFSNFWMISKRRRKVFDPTCNFAAVKKDPSRKGWGKRDCGIGSHMTAGI